MSKFLKIFGVPLLISIIAGFLYLIDALIGHIFIKNESFMWVAFAIWTIFYSSSIKDRVKGLIGIVIGFFSAVIMMLITNSFSVNVYTISLSCLLGVLLVNFLVMFLNRAEKYWLNSVTGAFAGIFLTFSGFGIGLSPIASVKEAFISLAVLITYSILGLICGFLSIYGSEKINYKIKSK